MPSFLADDREPMYSSHGNGYDDAGPLPLSHDKVNGSTMMAGKDTGRTGSYTDDLYRVKHININGDAPLADDDLPSATNGTSSAGSWDSNFSRNGTASTTNGSINGTINGASSRSPDVPHAVTQTTSDTHDTANHIDKTPSLPASSVNGRDQPSPEPPTRSAPPPPPSNPPPGVPQSALSASSPAPDAARASQPSPHRFSSPPAYPPPAPPGSTSTTTSSNLQHPGQAQLKHRHTLQVPKLTPGRGSKDGADDAITATGRFSPTSIPAGMRRGSLSLNRRNTRSIHSELYHEEVLQDEDAARWAEAIRQKRASKRKRKDDEDDDRVVVGTKVDQNHVNWVTAYNMLTGIRFTVSRTNAKLDRPLTDADFDARHKFSFDITGNELTPSAKYDFKFKDYAPWVFRSLRQKFGLDPADYLMSLTSKYILSELGSPGKSGSFFYFSRDYKYIIKTIHHGEHKFLRKILRDYYHHVEENPNTLLSQFYGLHRVKIPYGRKIHFVVMNNLFPPHRDIHQTFDLKGSTVGRDFKEEDLEKNPRATLKDLNWLRRHLHLEFGPEKKQIFLEQMERDVKLLQRLKIMDYSMLIGVHDMEKGNKDNLRDKTLQVFQPGGDLTAEDPGPAPGLKRTQSKLETERKARELRQIIKQERPIPMEQTNNRMPDFMEDSINKPQVFYCDDGGFRATHENNQPGEEIYYLGIIDCLTHYGMLKKLENFWKGLSHDSSQISPVPAEPYGTRFMNFIASITMSVEEAARIETSAVENEKATKQSMEGTRKRSGSQTLRSIPDLVANIGESQSSPKKSESSSGNDRMLTSVSSPSPDRAEPSMILPIVEEQREGSTSGSSQKGEADADDVIPPSTPPKDLSPHSRNQLTGSAKKANSMKDLPPLPPVASPEPMNEKQSIVA